MPNSLTHSLLDVT